MTDQGVQLERLGTAWIVTLSRPAVLNAVSTAMIEELLELMAAAADDPVLRVLILTGAGRAFCSGRDLREVANETRASIDRLQELSRRLVHHPKVVCAAVNGLAIGLGAELTVACDVRFAAESASFAFPEARRGLFFTGGVLHLLPRLVGSGRAAHWLLTGSSVSAPEALQAGLVSRVVPADRLREETLAFASEVAEGAPQSIQLLKQALRSDTDRAMETTLALEAEAAWQSLQTADAQARLHAFVERHGPG